MLTDLRHAWRALVRAPGYLAAAVCTLAVGIGATAALLGVVNAVLLRPLPYAAPERLVRVWPTNTVGKSTFVAMRERMRTLSSLGGWTEARAVSVLVDGTPARLQAADVTGSFFPTLGVAARLGRALGPDDELKTAERVAVVSDAFWRARLGADPRAVGRLVTLDGERVRIVGVMPPTVRLPAGDIALWTPARLDPTDVGDWHWYWNLQLVGRLAPGRTVADARAEARGLVDGLRARFPMRVPDAWGRDMDVAPLQGALVGSARGTLYLLLAAVGAVLVVAVVNVAGLTLVRMARRERELTVRAAVGAGRGRLLRVLLAEGVVLAAAAAALGTAIAWALTRAFVAALPRTAGRALPCADEIQLDDTALAAACLVAIACGVGATLLPAWRASRPDVRGALAEGGRSVGAGRARQRALETLVVAQIAIGVVVAAGAGVLGRSLLALLDVDPGFRAAHVATAELPLPPFTSDSVERGAAFYDAVLARVRAIPGVTHAAIGAAVPFAGGSETLGPIDVESRPVVGGADRANIFTNPVTPEFLRTLGVPLLAGRALAAGDRAGAPLVGLIDAAAARSFFPHVRDVVGQRVKFVYLKQWITVVGVVGDVRRDSLAADPVPTLYLPLAQRVPPAATLLVRADRDAVALAPALQAAVRDVDATVPLGPVRALDAAVAESAAQRRFVVQLLAAFAAAAVVLAVVGVYGVVAFTVARRTRELGVRGALGASPAMLRAHVLRAGRRYAAAGVALGLVGAVAAAHAARGVVPSLTPEGAHGAHDAGAADPVVLAAVGVLVGLAVLAAALVPARCAARVDPLVALRAD